MPWSGSFFSEGALKQRFFTDGQIFGRLKSRNMMNLNAIYSLNTAGFCLDTRGRSHRSILGEIVSQLTDDSALLGLFCLLMLTFGASHYSEFSFFTLGHAFP